MTPYYEDTASGITIYHADCRDVLPHISADVLVTDPPYGVNLGAPGVGQNGSGFRHGLLKGQYRSYEDTYENFLMVIVPALEQALSQVRRGAVFASPHLWDMPRADALGGVWCPSAAGRHRWGFKTLLPVLFYGTAPDLQLGAGSRPNVIRSTVRAEVNGHPCPKPIEWMRWLVGLTSLPKETVLDPFMGSGTTLRAAKDCGRRAIGVEIEEAYCEIAARRLAQGVLFSEAPA